MTKLGGLNMMSKIAGILMGLGFILLLGTAGACDLETVSLAQAAGQALVALLLMIAGFTLAYISDCKTDK